MGLLQVAQDTDQRQAHANTLMTLHFPRKRDFLECVDECLLPKEGYVSWCYCNT